MCREHRNEPGCVVGEHMQLFFLPETEPSPLQWPFPPPPPPLRCFATEIERCRGETGRPAENSTDREDGDAERLYMLMRVGEEERERNGAAGAVDELREENLAVDDTNPDENDGDEVRVP